jgi:hypothetical protein
MHTPIPKRERRKNRSGRECLYGTIKGVSGDLKNIERGKVFEDLLQKEIDLGTYTLAKINLVDLTDASL